MRFIPFGYEISDAEVQVIEKEAEVVKNIFGLYVQGMSLKKISDRLNLLPIKYAEGKTWDKNHVKRILDNPKYTGDQGYPVIIPTETAKMAHQIKEKKSPGIDHTDKCRVDAFHDKARCAECGGKMLKVRSGSGVGRRIYWKCGNTDCIGNRHVMNEVNLEQAVADILNEISDHLEIVRVDVQKTYSKNESIVYAENALNELMEKKEAETSEVIGQMLELASAKFNLCMHGDYSAVTQRIESYMAAYPHRDTVDGKVIKEIVKVIKISPYKTVTVKLINGKELAREHVSKWYKGKEDAE